MGGAAGAVSHSPAASAARLAKYPSRRAAAGCQEGEGLELHGWRSEAARGEFSSPRATRVVAGVPTPRVENSEADCAETDRWPSSVAGVLLAAAGRSALARGCRSCAWDATAESTRRTGALFSLVVAFVGAGCRPCALPGTSCVGGCLAARMSLETQRWKFSQRLLAGSARAVTVCRWTRGNLPQTRAQAEADDMRREMQRGKDRVLKLEEELADSLKAAGRGVFQVGRGVAGIRRLAREPGRGGRGGGRGGKRRGERGGGGTS